MDGHPSSDFCEDCVNGKLTWVPHTCPVMHAEVPLQQVYSDVHGPVSTRSWWGNVYWVSFIDDYSCFPAVYFIRNKSDVFGVFKQYRVWAENMTGCRISVLCDNKGGEYTLTKLDRYLAEAGIHHEHLIQDTPQQLGIMECLNRTLDEGITTLLSQSRLSHAWWEDATLHFLYRKIQLPSSITAPNTPPNTPYDLFYGKKGSFEHLQPFGCLVYVHLQKDQCRAFQLHVLQCILIGYPTDYKGWHFWDPVAHKEVISNSTVFHKSVFPHWQPGLSLAVPETVLCWIMSCPVNDSIESEEVAVDAAPPPDAFDVMGDVSMSPGDICIPILNAMECVFSMATKLEPRSLKEALKCLDAAEWVGATLKEIDAHLQNGTWEPAQLPPGRHTIGSQWVFKIKRMPEGLIKKYKGWLVAQGFSQVPCDKTQGLPFAS